MQRLMRRLHPRRRYARGHRFDALPLTGQQQASAIESERRRPAGLSERCCPCLDIGCEPWFAAMVRRIRDPHPPRRGAKAVDPIQRTRDQLVTNILQVNWQTSTKAGGRVFEVYLPAVASRATITSQFVRVCRKQQYCPSCAFAPLSCKSASDRAIRSVHPRPRTPLWVLFDSGRSKS
jgi:hypothetical protein